MQNNRVLLAMSGGVDSSVAAYLLQQQGFDVAGITFIFWENDQIEKNDRIQRKYVDNARAIADQLGIQHIVKDVRSDFKTNVLDYFYEEYLEGRTPFPCVICNNTVKWHHLEKMADELDFSYLATGHYTNILHQNKYHYLTCALDPDKDQTFFLWGLSQKILARSLFPLGELQKISVKEIAKKQGWVSVADNKESTGPCFIEGNDYRVLLNNLMTSKDSHPGEGHFINENGKILGKHHGYPYYTVGQRRGLGINVNKPYYVKATNPIKNTVTLCAKESLYVNSFYINRIQLVNPEDILNKSISVKIRYRKQITPCRLELLDENNAKVNLLEPLDSIAPGQAAVFYEKEKVLGGGFITNI